MKGRERKEKERQKKGRAIPPNKNPDYGPEIITVED